MDDRPECEENGGVAANNLCTENPQSCTKEEEENMLRNSDDHGGTALEELLKQRTFTRSEFEYLANLLWSKTIGANSLKLEDGNVRKMIVYDKENASEYSNLPLNFSTTTFSADDQVATPAEIAKAYMGLKSSKGSPLRLRLHDPSSMPITSMEVSMSQKAKPPTIPLAQGSRLHTSKTSDCLESNYTTPNGVICKMSSSPYFKSGVSSKELFGSVSSHYQTSNSVHTFGRQVLKRKSTVSNEFVSAGPIRRIHQRYNRTSPLLETQLGYRRYPVGYGSKLEGSEQLARTQKRRCLDKVGDASLGSVEDKTNVNYPGQVPEKSAEMATKILKQLDTLVPSQKENTSETKQKHESAIYFEEDVSRQKKVQAERDLLEPSPSEVEYSLPDGIASNKSISQITLNKEKPPAFSSRGNAPNLVLSDEIGRSKMSTPGNGFTFPAPTVNNAYSQGPPTPTLTSPILTVEKQPSVFCSASVTSAQSDPRISKSVLGGPVTQKLESKLNGDNQRVPSKNSGQVASFTSNPVFKVDGPGHASNSVLSAVQSYNTSTGSVSFQSAGSSTISTNLTSNITQSCSTGGSFTFSNTRFGSLSATSNMFAAKSLALSCTASPGASLGFPPVHTASSPAAHRKSEAANSSISFSSMQQFGIAGSSTVQDKSKAVDSSTPFGFPQKFDTVSSASEDMSKADSPEPTFFSGNHNVQSENCSSLFTQSPGNNLSSKSSENLNSGSSHSFADSPVGSATMCSSPSNSNSLFSWAAGSGARTAPPSSPATSSSFAFNSSPAFSAQPVFASKLTTPASLSYGSPNTGPATSPFSSMPSAVFSFTSATPSIPNPSPTTPIFGDPTVQMNGGNIVIDRNGSPSPATSPFGLPSSSPSTPTFSTPATQFASSTSGSPGVFEIGKYSQASSGGFSMGPSGGNDKSNRRIVRVKRRK